MVIALGGRLLELDHRRVPAELAEPCVRVAVGAGGARRAHVADVEAQPDRDVAIVARSQKLADHRHGGWLARRGKVLDDQVRQPCLVRLA